MRLVSALTGLLHLPRAHEGVETSRAVNRLMRPADAPRELDPLVIWPTVALLLIGLVMVYSSSIALAEESRFTGHQSHYFLLRHAVFLLAGIVASLVAFRISLRQWQQLAPWLFMTGLVLLIVVLIPG
ncbi:MAG: FtsW/RodA/SpoVE family cell cycle protein, partial [Rhodocyclales bacterium]|nr:FtsW/RodA/SpoVE family cell cycle protein [Rhodocyclales bacterium]